MFTPLRSGVAPPRLLFLGAFLLFAADAALALRLPSLNIAKSHSIKGCVDDDVFREVISEQSTFHAGLLTPGLEARAGDLAGFTKPLGNLKLASAAQLRDPALATVFSTQAAKRLPRLARGPAAPLTSPRTGAGGDTAAGAAAGSRASDSQQQHHHGHQQHQEYQQSEQQHGGAPGAAAAAEAAEALRAADPTPPDFNIDEAFLAGRLASIAYCSHPDLLAAWNCSRCFNVSGGFVPHAVVYDPVWDLAAYAGHHTATDTIVLAFRGTDSSNWGQWAENMRAWRTDHMYPVPDFPHALIHAGFYTLWTGSSLQGAFTTAAAELLAAHPSSRLMVTGHSMGGALAQLAALELKLKHNSTSVTVYTFGAPRVGNLAYQQLFNSFVDVSWRLTHNRDIVPSVPLQLMGFQHVAREVWEVDVEDPVGGGGSERKLLLCDGSGEDPSCHNSACYLGLCTSIADHLEYLGLHMYQDSDEC